MQSVINFMKEHWPDILSIGIACIAAIIAYLSYKASNKSAAASETSSQTAVNALELERQRFEHQKLEAIINFGSPLFREAWIPGSRKVLGRYPELLNREELGDILLRIFRSSGIDFPSSEAMFNALEENKIIKKSLDDRWILNS